MKAWAGILNIARKEKWPMLVIGLPGVQGDIVEIRTKNGRLAYTIKMTEINKYNKALKNLCAKRGIPFLNVSGQWQKNKGKGLFAADGFHLNVRGHQLLATQVYKQIKKMKILQAGLK